MKHYVCEICGKKFDSRMARNNGVLCAECRRQERLKNKREEDRIKRREERIANHKTKPCPHSPDCTKCPLPDCRIANPERYNVLASDLYRDDDWS